MWMKLFPINSSQLHLIYHSRPSFNARHILINRWSYYSRILLHLNRFRNFVLFLIVCWSFAWHFSIYLDAHLFFSLYHIYRSYLLTVLFSSGEICLCACYVCSRTCFSCLYVSFSSKRAEETDLFYIVEICLVPDAFLQMPYSRICPFWILLLSWFDWIYWHLFYAFFPASNEVFCDE